VTRIEWEFVALALAALGIALVGRLMGWWRG